MVSNLKELRERLGLTRIELVAESGLSTDTIWRLEENLGSPKLATAYRLARVLRCHVEDIFPNEESECSLLTKNAASS